MADQHSAPAGIPHRRMRKFLHRSCSTPGKSKGKHSSCAATPQDRLFAKYSRSYKWPNYSLWWKDGVRKK